MKQFVRNLLLMHFMIALLLQSATTRPQGHLKTIDSILAALPFHQDDSTKVRLLNTLSYKYFVIDPDKGISYGERSASLAAQIRWEPGLAGAYHSIASNYWAKNDLYHSQLYFWKAFKIHEQLGNRRGIAKGYHSFGVIYETQRRPLKALPNYKKALQIYQSIGDVEGELGCLSNIADTYERMALYDSSIAFHLETLKIRQRLNNLSYIAFTEDKIGAMYALKGDHRTALSYQKPALEKMITAKDSMGIGGVLNSIATSFRYNGELDSALNYYHSALTVYSLLKGNSVLGIRGKILGSIGDIYREQSLTATAPTKTALLTRAASYFKDAIQIAGKVLDKNSLMTFHYSVFAIDSAQGKLSEALKNYKLYVQYRDSVRNDEDERLMMQQESSYQFEKYTDSARLAQVNMLQKEKSKRQEIIFAGLVLIILFIVCAIYIIYTKRIDKLKLKNQLSKEQANKKINEARLQQQIHQLTLSAIRSQMNPHFIFNALNTIQSLIYSEDKVNATEYLGKFSELVRKILANSLRTTITVSEEIEMLNLYIDIEQKRYGNNFVATIEVDNNIDTDAIEIPPMLVQPYVENAIKHGLIHKQGHKQIQIRFGLSANKTNLQIIIQDNGIGRQKSMELNRQRARHQSFANEANEKRMTLISQVYGNAARVEITDDFNEAGIASGTIVTITIPLELQYQEVSNLQHEHKSNNH
jgi:two-component system, LytTR family, sensor kinase